MIYSIHILLCHQPKLIGNPIKILNCNLGYRKTDELLNTYGADEGTSNLAHAIGVVEIDENENATEEKVADMDKGATNVVGIFESNPDPTQQSRRNGSKIVIFSEPK